MQGAATIPAQLQDSPTWSAFVDVARSRRAARERVEEEISELAGALRREVLLPEQIGHFEELQAARQAVGARLAPWQSSSPAYPSTSIRTFVRKGYRGNVAFRACVDLITRTMLEGELTVVDRRTKESDPDDPMLAVIEKPTNVQGIRDRMRRTVVDLYSTGNAFWEKVRDAQGRVVELWRLSPARVRIEPGEGPRWVERYWYEVAGTWYPIPTENVLHFLFPDPDDIDEPSFFGLPPIAAALRSMTADSELTDQLTVTLQNRAIPAVILRHDDKTPTGTSPLTEEKATEAKRRWRQNYGGRNRGDVAVTDMSVEVIGMSWKEMALGDVIAVPESRIAMVHGVPMVLLGRSGTSGDQPARATYQDAKEHFWTSTVISLQNDLAETLDVWLRPEWPGWQGRRTRFDNAEVPVLQAARVRRLADTSQACARGVISTHAAQRLAGVPLHGPDVFLIPGTVGRAVPADAKSFEEPPPEEL